MLRANLSRPTLQQWARWNTLKRFLSCELPKNFNQEIAASYDPAEVEKGWYSWWEQNGLFEPESCDAGGAPFSMVIPPPNVTGSLHIGHALTNTLQDSLVRWRRMKGDRVCWVPGLDHAGIATQTMVEKHIKNSMQKTRHDLGREDFIKNVWKWYEQYGGRINSQLRQMGFSLAWRRAAFTLDEPRSRAVTEAFVRLHQQGLIFRSARMIHWCPHLRTAISDIEVEFLEVTGRTKHKLPNGRFVEVGVLHRLEYEVISAVGAVVGRLPVDTTRPETLLADQALALHPEDDRYKVYHGLHALHPISGARLPIVLDSVLVDPALGTGVVKVTPAHDPADYECGKRHGLSVVNLLNDDGTINQNVPKQFQGMHRFLCREAVISALSASGHYQGARDHPMRLALCSRSADILEPMLKPQWFVRCNEMNEAALAAVLEKRLRLHPEARDADWARWLSTESSQSWCISRQLWWGHRIPAYRVTVLPDPTPSTSTPTPIPCGDAGDEGEWVVAGSEGAARQQVAQRLGVPEHRIALQQDEDVLDTWFSSALFPMTVWGWPDTKSSGDALPGYPLSVMVTGRDIMFFWVARMVLLCSQLSPNQQLPFPHTVLHPLIRGSDGRKMSKSLGNVIDPCDLMEGRTLPDLLARLKASNLDPKQQTLAENLLKKDYPAGMKACGADALRLALLQRVNLDDYIALDYKKVLTCRQLANKIWQAARFVLPHAQQLAADGGDQRAPTALWQSTLQPARLQEQYDQLNDAQRWVLSELSCTVSLVNTEMAAFNWRPCADGVAAFVVNKFCDVFIEFTKTGLVADNQTTTPAQKDLSRALLTLCWETFLRLLHPMMPFLSEELWQRLAPSVRSSASASIMRARFPETDDFAFFATSPDALAATQRFETVLSVLATFRTLFESSKAALKLTPAASRSAANLLEHVHIVVSPSESPELRASLEAALPDLAFLMRAKPGCLQIVTSLDQIPSDFSVLPVSSKSETSSASAPSTSSSSSPTSSSASVPTPTTPPTPTLHVALRLARPASEVAL